MIPFSENEPIYFRPRHILPLVRFIEVREQGPDPPLPTAPIDITIPTALTGSPWERGDLEGAYMPSNPQIKSNRFSVSILPFKSIAKSWKQLQRIFSNFSVFSRHLLSCYFYFYVLSIVQRFVHLLPPQVLIPSWGSALPESGLNPTIWSPNRQRD